MARDEAREWLALAAIDARAARKCLVEPDAAPQAALYHCQQAAEKIAKAALVAAGIAPPRIHDIGALLDRLRPDDPILPLMRELELLTVYGLAYRYPADESAANPPIPSGDEISAWIDQIEAAAGLLSRTLG
jgi:HEPN domain-containing protein